MCDGNGNNVETESWRVQLTELNNRSRWYSNQLWQLPFTYLAVTAIAIANLDDSHKPLIFGLSFLAASLVGSLVSWHMCGLLDGEKRAVKNLQYTEQMLGLPRTAQYKKYVRPLWLIVVLSTIVYFLIALLMLVPEVTQLLVA